MTGATKALYYILKNDSGVSAIVGTKIYSRTASQGAAAPFIVMTIVSVDPQDTKDRPSSVDHVRVQIDCYEVDYGKVEVLHDAVRDALDNNVGTHNTVKVDGLKYETENDIVDEDTDLFRRSADYIVRVKY